MNSLKISFIFASVLGAILFVSPSKGFSKAIKNDSNAKAQVLAKGSEIKFSKFVSENLSRFTKKEDWSTIQNIVILYNQSPSKLLSTRNADKKAFLEATKTLINKLNRRKGIEAAKWSSDLGKTVKEIQFIWNFDIDSLTPVIFETPLFVAPKITVESL
jgi:hypothetical protein